MRCFEFRTRSITFRLPTATTNLKSVISSKKNRTLFWDVDGFMKQENTLDMLLFKIIFIYDNKMLPHTVCVYFTVIFDFGAN